MFYKLNKYDYVWIKDKSWIKNSRSTNEKNTYILVLGDKESEHQNVTIRKYGQQILAEKPLKQVVEEIKQEMRNKALSKRKI